MALTGGASRKARHLVRLVGRARPRVHRPYQLSARGGVTTATIDLEEQDVDEYYNGYANRTLWPLFHYRIDLAEYDRSFGGGYERVNERFAETVGAADRARRPGLGPRLSSDPARPAASPARAQEPHRLLPPHPVAAAPAAGLAAVHQRLVDRCSPMTWSASRPRNGSKASTIMSSASWAGRSSDDGTVTVGDRTVKARRLPDRDRLQRVRGSREQRGSAMQTYEQVRRSVEGSRPSSASTGSIIPRASRSASSGYRRFLEDIPTGAARSSLLQIAPPSRGEVHTYQRSARSSTSCRAGSTANSPMSTGCRSATSTRAIRARRWPASTAPPGRPGDPAARRDEPRRQGICRGAGSRPIPAC